MRRLALLITFAVSMGRSSAQSPALIGYYAGDGADLYGRNIGQLTHLIWCFTTLQGDSLAPLSKAQDKVLRKMVGFKREHPELKVLVSFGGWGGCERCSDVFSREVARRKFAAGVLALLKRTWTDGIDLDWEYPAVQGPPGHAFKPEDRHNFTLLVRELRRQLGDRYEISFAAGGTDECLVQGFEWDSIMPLVDRVHIMSYDLVHGYSPRTGHHTSLFPVKGQPLSAARAVHVLDSLHVPRTKVVIGAATYDRIFKDVPPADHGLFQPGSFERAISFSAIDTTITAAKGWQWFRDEQAGAAYAYNTSERRFLTGDDVHSIQEKARYVRKEGLGGIMFWQLRDDKLKGGLLDAMYHALRDP
jgi:chitinase